MHTDELAGDDAGGKLDGQRQTQEGEAVVAVEVREPQLDRRLLDLVQRRRIGNSTA